MAVLVVMPKQGQSVESCIITEIKKKKGDAVKKGYILYSYETDKASFEEESPIEGIVLECFYNDGDEVPVLQNMMVIGEPGEDYSDLTGNAPEPQQNLPDKNESLPQNTASPKSLPVKENNGNAQGFISPRARHSAEKEALNIAAIAGSGAKGRIMEKDVLAALHSSPKLTTLARKIAVADNLQTPENGSGLAGSIKAVDLLPPPVNTVYGDDYEDKKLTNMRKIIARTMHASLQNSAQLTHHLGADARKIMSLRKQAKKAFEENKIQVNLTINDFVCFAVIKALKKFPSVNSHFLGEHSRLFRKVHLGLAVDTERGLMVPAVRNADDLSVFGLAAQLKGIADQCRKGSIAPELLSAEAASFTVSNLGNYGVEIFTPVINLPQAAILGVNTIIPRAKDLGDGVYAFVPYMGLSLTYDHRALDGGEATRFLKQIATEIETLEVEL
jgi:pyruvate dehydrogenase E2 component (dihydrolipoamide acetyltransferase)